MKGISSSEQRNSINSNLVVYFPSPVLWSKLHSCFCVFLPCELLPMVKTHSRALQDICGTLHLLSSVPQHSAVTGLGLPLLGAEGIEGRVK